MNIKNKKIFLLLIILLAAFLRLFKLDAIPSSLNWDEVDAGYNAYSIAHFGKDEWGEAFPLVFTSFRDDKHPVHIYTLAFFVKFVGLSEFVTRLPSALLGVLSVLLIFYLAEYLFQNYLTSIFAAFFLAISPYHLQFSRGLWESNFALSFFLLGLVIFFKALAGHNKLLSISFLSFGISLLSYHSSKVIVIPLVLLLIALYSKQLRKLTFNYYCALAIFLVFIALLVFNPRLAGIARIKQTQISQKQIEETTVFQKTHIPLLGLSEITLKGMLAHFDPKYLFAKGDQSPRNSVKEFGEFYKTDALFILFGIVSLIKLKSKITIFILSWLLLAPLPGSVVAGAPNANRALFMLGSVNLITALGASKTVELFKGRFKKVILIIILMIVLVQAIIFLKYYFEVYPRKDYYDWIYGMKQVVLYTKDNEDKYDQIFVTDIRSQPYIFFLYYLKYPLPDFIHGVLYNNRESKTFSTVSYFGKYYFGGWDPIESVPEQGRLYVLTPNEYDGLRHKAEFDVKKIIYYPDGSTAFFLVDKN